MLGPILLVALILTLVGSLPVYRYSSDWGYFPSGILATVLLLWLILFFVGRV